MLFEIYHNDASVGKAQIHQEGMYYRIFCCCEIDRPGFYRIIVCDGKNEVDLGICVPKEDKFVLVSRIPAKRLQGASKRFQLVKHEEYKKMTEERSKKVPVASGKPFQNIDELENAIFSNEDGKSILIIDPTPDRPDNDQNQRSL